MKLLIPLFILLIISCSKEHAVGPNKVQDIRGTEWLSKENVGSTYPGGSVYMMLHFFSGSDFYSGSGMCGFQLEDGTAIGYSDMTWKLDYGQDPKNKTQIAINYTDWSGNPQSKIGAWVIGTLFIDGIDYEKQ